ncbi:MAG: hypothetical protein ACRD3W_04925 [Terriglobales bacterium]
MSSLLVFLLLFVPIATLIGLLCPTRRDWRRWQQKRVEAQRALDVVNETRQCG